TLPTGTTSTARVRVRALDVNQFILAADVSDGNFTISSSVTPPTVQTLAAGSVTTTSATLNGNVNPNGSTTTVYFEYGTTASYGSQTAAQVFTGSTPQSVTANATGLITGTTYHYRIVAKNGGGTSTGSDVAFTTTATPTPTPTPTCPAPTVRISSDRNSIHKGEDAIIDLFTGSSSASLCHNVTV